MVKVGGSLDIRLETADAKDLGWKEGTVLNIEDVVEVKDGD